VYRLLTVWVAMAALAVAAPARAAPMHGLVYDDRNGDGRPSLGEPGIANAVVAFGIHQFAVTDAHGGFVLDLAPTDKGIVWVRVPDGFVPGPVWAHIDGSKPDLPIDLGLRRLAAPHHGPITFVVTADSHISPSHAFGNDLAQAMADATALDPPPAFMTILGDITHGNQRAQFELVDRQLAGLGVPYIPVPGNHDWYDGGASWFAHYGPDNYSFDIDTTHFVVWNMALKEDEIRHYLGAELAHVDKAMTIVALTHAPPPPSVIPALRDLGVAYVLTGHTHSNRIVDHDNPGEVVAMSDQMLGDGRLVAAGNAVAPDPSRLEMLGGDRQHVAFPQLRIVGVAIGRDVIEGGMSHRAQRIQDDRSRRFNQRIFTVQIGHLGQFVSIKLNVERS